jgi:site-specific DNA-cytosine methylase
MIPSLDLFSGIGGFALALKSIATPVAYCEIDAFCRDILKQNMDRGRLPRARIYEDVRTLPINEIAAKQPRIITAGFPCQDISIANLRGKGILGPKSSLFFHILRIIDAVDSVDTVVLENVPNIVHTGLSIVCDELVKRGFELRWGVFGAHECGALHRRYRWFMLATKPHGNAMSMLGQLDFQRLSEQEPVPRIVPLCGVNKRWNFHAMTALGNAIVPDQARFAITSLSNANADNAKPVSQICGSSHHVYFRAHSTLCAKRSRAISRTDLGLFIQSANHAYRTPLWPTPISSVKHQYLNPDRRHLGIFCNAVFYEQKTYQSISHICQPYHVNRHFRINHQFVTWLMGYPLDWLDEHLETTPQGGAERSRTEDFVGSGRS